MANQNRYPLSLAEDELRGLAKKAADKDMKGRNLSAYVQEQSFNRHLGRLRKTQKWIDAGRAAVFRLSQKHGGSKALCELVVRQRIAKLEKQSYPFYQQVWSNQVQEGLERSLEIELVQELKRVGAWSLLGVRPGTVPTGLPGLSGF